MIDPTDLFLTILFSAIGLGYYRYGKRQERLTALVSGVGLMMIPYFVGSTVQLLLFGAALILSPLVIRV